MNTDVKIKQAPAHAPTAKFNVYRPHARHRKEFHKPSLAKQSFADECNINTIMSRFNATGVIEHTNKKPPQYGDLAGFEDYHAALNITIEANDAFDQLPSAIRTRFHNEPSEFLAFAENEDNLPEMVKLGLAEAPDVPVLSSGDDAPGHPDQVPQEASEGPPDPTQTGD